MYCMSVLSKQLDVCLLAHPVAQALLTAKPGAPAVYLLQRLRPMAAHCLSCTTYGGTFSFMLECESEHLRALLAACTADILEYLIIPPSRLNFVPEHMYINRLAANRETRDLLQMSLCLSLTGLEVGHHRG